MHYRIRANGASDFAGATWRRIAIGDEIDSLNTAIANLQNAFNGYLPLAGGMMTGTIGWHDITGGERVLLDTDFGTNDGVSLIARSPGVDNGGLVFKFRDDSSPYLDVEIPKGYVGDTAETWNFRLADGNGNAYIPNTITATKHVTIGGTASQYVRGDGELADFVMPSSFWSGSNTGGDCNAMTVPGCYSGLWTENFPPINNHNDIIGTLLTLASHTTASSRPQIFISTFGHIYYRAYINDTWYSLTSVSNQKADLGSASGGNSISSPTIGVTGILPVGNGGTGVNNLDNLTKWVNRFTSSSQYGTNVSNPTVTNRPALIRWEIAGNNQTLTIPAANYTVGELVLVRIDNGGTARTGCKINGGTDINLDDSDKNNTVSRTFIRLWVVILIKGSSNLEYQGCYPLNLPKNIMLGSVSARTLTVSSIV